MSLSVPINNFTVPEQDTIICHESQESNLNRLQTKFLNSAFVTSNELAKYTGDRSTIFRRTVLVAGDIMRGRQLVG